MENTADSDATGIRPPMTPPAAKQPVEPRPELSRDANLAVPRHRPGRGIIAGAVVLVLVGVLAVAGFYVADTQVAAWVGSTPILESRVRDIAQAISTQSSENADELAPTLLFILIQERIGHQVSLSLGTVISDDQRRDTLKDSTRLSALAEEPVTHDFIAEYVDLSVAMREEQYQTAFLSLIKATPITLNARYGTWNQETGEFKAP